MQVKSAASTQSTPVLWSRHNTYTVVLCNATWGASDVNTVDSDLCIATGWQKAGDPGFIINLNSFSIAATSLIIVFDSDFFSMFSHFVTYLNR